MSAAPAGPSTPVSSAPPAPAPAALWPGLLLCLAISAVSLWLGRAPQLAHFGLSSLTLSIVLGLVAGNLWPRLASGTRAAGVTFSKGTLLRAGIVLYGFRLTLHQLLGIGWAGLVADVLMLSSTFFLTYLLGTRLFRLDAQTSALMGAGSSICGAAAVLATQPVVRARAEQVTVAVATVVLYGTVGIFLYPQMAAAGLWPFGGAAYGIYIGSSVHEVAQVVAAGQAISPEVADAAVTAKMLRVMLLAPFLLALAAWWSRRTPLAEGEARTPISVPWFAFGFVAVTLLNSALPLPANVTAGLIWLDTALLTAAMAALGLTTQLRTLLQAGIRPLLLGLVVFAWLVMAGGLLQTWVQGW
ncbi:Uncharacterized protein family UPF0324 (plasmid) [Deinococcus proteolyticus MRP]|uniref:Uncharacterized protein family UPF0324 n=1 Tax=Deinococcus proteolyticus (strain ATCC 35074 / DSM 20540 / JCM 6276 / NBRC 101906 / NCIMB 13154 / VKM Ac-1939 / CCM 2703 / MRP) TaxID=693977 RepID=F0RQT5_DEIPM|nr:YeiH family protein [Deinococcus proteolyticus]ADY27644.1 Uncharacterized protein family UPF0324 [Deinococcus proteolyticus MRP]